MKETTLCILVDYGKNHAAEVFASEVKTVNKD